MYKIFLTIVGLLMFVSSLQAATMHAILIGDTGDFENVSYSRSAMDIDYVHNELIKLLPGTPLTIEEHVLMDNDFTFPNLEKIISDLTVGPQDIIFFYYSGPAERINGLDKLFPHILSHQGPARMMIDFPYVQTEFLAKKPRLFIALLEGNNVDKIDPQKSKPGAEFKISEKRDKKIVNLLSANGWFVACASKPNTYATSGENGGEFTRAFFEAFHKTNKFSDPSFKKNTWKDLMNLVADDLKKEPFPSYPVAEAKLN